MHIHFTKYQGTGNDFIIIDDRLKLFPENNSELIEKLCNRKFGIGADGLMLLQPDDNAAYYMKYYNSDGKESSMCGNGGRCIAAFAIRLGIVQGTHTFNAIDGLHEVKEKRGNNQIKIQLGMQDVNDIEIRNMENYVLNTGSPHYIQFTPTNINEINIVEEARKIRYNEEFKSNGINVNFINLLGINKIAIRTYERGVEDETLSCGTGVTAAAITTAIINQLVTGVHKIDVETKGGNLSVSFMYHKIEKIFSDVWLTGPATFVFEGEIAI